MLSWVALTEVNPKKHSKWERGKGKALILPCVDVSRGASLTYPDKCFEIKTNFSKGVKVKKWFYCPIIDRWWNIELKTWLRFDSNHESLESVAFALQASPSQRPFGCFLEWSSQHEKHFLVDSKPSFVWSDATISDQRKKTRSRNGSKLLLTRNAFD